MNRSLAACLTSFAISWLAVASYAAASFPEVTAEQRALVHLEAFPDAPAVVLDRVARLALVDGGRSTLDVRVRLKVLDDAGTSYGQIAIGHGATVRLTRFEGRTVKADGEVVPLSDDALFTEERVSGRVAKAAFPAVEVGAILDYRFQLGWDSIYFLEPWYLDDRIPTVRSSLTYVEPPGLRVAHHLRDSGRGRVTTDEQRSPRGREVTLLGEQLPPVVEESFGPVFADLALRVMVVPEARLADDGTATPLLDRWRSVAVAAERGYDTARRFSRRARRLAQQRTRGASDHDAKVEVIFALVRERVRALDGTVFVGADASLDRVLDRGAGSYAEVALLLHTMLDAVGVGGQLVWAGDWRGGRPDLEVVNPGWFTKVLVRLERDGRWLDPGDRRLALGRLSPTQEGTEALIVEGTRSVVETLPSSPGETSARRASLSLAIDDEGRVAGRGTLALTGHHAWFYLDRFASADANRTAWQRWLEQHIEGFEVDQVTVEESRDDQRIVIAWHQRQRDAEVLGDEVSLDLSQPLGPLRQRYSQPAEARQLPVHIAFADLDEIETTIQWPADWTPDLLPDGVAVDNEAGEASVVVRLADGTTTLGYRRILRIDRTRFRPPTGYAALRALYAAMERADAAPLVVIRE